MSNVDKFEIACDKWDRPNPCTGMTETQAKAAFDMYTGPQGSGGATFRLFKNGKQVGDARTVVKGSAKNKAKADEKAS